jgi:hypothetical protein
MTAEPERRPEQRRTMAFGLDRFTIAMAAGGLLLVAVALAVVLARPGESPPLDESRPAGVVHNYLLALQNDDPQTAYGYLTAEARAETPYERFAAQRRFHPTPAPRDRIIDEKIEGESARVTVQRTIPSGGIFPFTSDEYRSERTVVLRREEGRWKIAQSPLGLP